MQFLLYLSDMMIPMVIFYLVGYGLLAKTDVYTAFLQGAKTGMKTVLDILPTLIGLFVAVGALRTSGALDFLAGLLQKAVGGTGIPSPLIPLVLVRLFSSSAATGMAVDIFKEFGTDSYAGMAASILMSCTETVFYTMSVYFAAAKVTRTRYTLPGALIATAAGAAASLILAGRI